MTDTFDLTGVLYTAKTIPNKFYLRIVEQLDIALEGLPMVLNEIKDSSKRSHCNIYRQALEGAKEAQTRYIALCEDDTLYSPAHFKYRPKTKPFAYNLAYWGIYTWQDPAIFNYKGRKNLGNLVCEREAFIEAMEERFRVWPDENKVDTNIWAEPGKYERQLGVTIRETEDFYSHPPNIKFSHENELSFAGLGTRKRAGELRAERIPYWGEAAEIRSLYK